MSIAPVWGSAGSRSSHLLSASDAGELGTEHDFEATARLEAELGYGIGVPRTRGVVTPYARLSLGQHGNRTWRTGARWNVAPEATLGLGNPGGKRRGRHRERHRRPRRSPLVKTTACEGA